MPAYDTSHLLELLRGHTHIPSAPGYTDADCLRALTATLHGYVLPIVKADYQDHWLAADSATSEIALVAAQREYAIPRRAVATSIRKAVLLDTHGKPHVLRLAELDAAEERNEDPGQPRWYVPTAGRIRLYPTPSAGMAGWTLRLSMLVRPARLVPTTDCGLVTVATDNGSGSYSITLSGAAAGALVGATSVDVVRAVEPYEAVSLEVASTVLGAAVTLTGVPEDGVAVGDYVCPAGASPFAQCPVELLDMLAVRTAVEQLASIGDASVATAKAASMQERRKDAHSLVIPRTGEPRTRPNGMNKWRGGRSGRGGHGGEWT